MKILFFATSRLTAGVAEEEMEVADSLTATELWEQLLLRHPALGQVRASTRLAKNGVYAGDDAKFTNTDEVALIPPVSGG